MTLGGPLVSLLISIASAVPPGADASWDSISSRPVPIECTEVAGVPWCRSRGVIAAPSDLVASALEGMKAGSNEFESVLSVRVLAPDTIHVVLDYPAPLTDRDYVAKYSREVDGEVHTYSWVPVTHTDAPEGDNAVRLPSFEGSWRLEPHEAGTLVTYTWQAQIAGSFPAFAYKKAWQKAGSEALKDLANTRDAELTAP